MYVYNSGLSDQSPTHELTAHSHFHELQQLTMSVSGLLASVLLVTAAAMADQTRMLDMQQISQTDSRLGPARTRMVVMDSGSGTAYLMDLGEELDDYHVTPHHIPALLGFRDVDYDFVNERLYILAGDYRTIRSVQLDGSDERQVAALDYDSYVVAVAPHAQKVFASMLPHRDTKSRLVAMDTDGGNKEILRRSKLEAPNMGVDHENGFLYWTEYLCSCLYRMPYEGGEPEKFGRMYLKQSPHAVDYEHGVMYGDAKKGLYRFDLRTAREELIYPYKSSWADETVYDPITDRIFIYNNDNSSDVKVLTTTGELVGMLQGVELTPTMRKAIRINPL